MEIDNIKYFDPNEVVKQICNFFINIATTLRNKLPRIPKIFDVESFKFKEFYAKKGIMPKSFKPSRVSEDYILKKLCKLNPNKSTGIDEIPAKFLKDGATEIKTVITHLINLSIDTATVPDELKFAKVIPLYKKIADWIREILDQ